eukprot:m.261536 g.261536  ORF g.261536 m.261536 type:complete len:227 (-) comp17599_c0_seq5:121-801(-)
MDTRQDQDGAYAGDRAFRNLNRLMLDYFGVEGLQAAAKTLEAEAELPPHDVVRGMADRHAIRETIEAGRVAEAFDMVNDMFPGIFDENPQLYFRMRLQQLVELIRADKVSEALAFAQRELTPLTRNDPDQLKEVEYAISTLVVRSPFQDSPESRNKMLEQQRKGLENQRRSLGIRVNAAMIEAMGCRSTSQLSDVVRLLLWSESQLPAGSDVQPLDIAALVETGEL